MRGKKGRLTVEVEVRESDAVGHLYMDTTTRMGMPLTHMCQSWGNDPTCAASNMIGRARYFQ